jgi:hypothetical protein
LSVQIKDDKPEESCGVVRPTTGQWPQFPGPGMQLPASSPLGRCTAASVPRPAGHPRFPWRRRGGHPRFPWRQYGGLLHGGHPRFPWRRYGGRLRGVRLPLGRCGHRATTRRTTAAAGEAMGVRTSAAVGVVA